MRYEFDETKVDDVIRAALASAPRPVPSAARPVTPYTCPKCHALWLHWPAEQTGFGRDTLNCRSTAHCHYCENGGVEQLQRLERVPAVLSAPQPAPTPQEDSQPAPARAYPPLPDFETVERHIFGACRRYITQDMLEPIHNLIRDAIDADRAVLAKWATPPAVVGEPVAWLDPWTGTNVTTDYDAYGKHGIPLYTAPQPAQAQAGAVPLTPKQVAEIADAAHREYDRLVGSGQCAPRWSAVFAHLLERAHGIGIKNGGRHE